MQTLKDLTLTMSQKMTVVKTSSNSSHFTVVKTSLNSSHFYIDQVTYTGKERHTRSTQVIKTHTLFSCCGKELLYAIESGRYCICGQYISLRKMQFCMSNMSCTEQVTYTHTPEPTLPTIQQHTQHQLKHGLKQIRTHE